MTFDLIDDETNDIVCHVLTTVLSVPEVHTAVMAKACQDLGQDEMKYLHNEGVNSLSDLAFYYLWERVKGTGK